MKYQHKKFAAMGTALLLIFPLTACTETGNTESGSTIESIIESAYEPSAVNTGEAVEGALTIELEDGATQPAKGVTVDGDVITITKTGSYALSGTLTNGQIVVDAEGADITLTLNGVDITCGTSAPVYIKSADKVDLVLANGSSNILTDTEKDALEGDTDEPKATLFSKTDLSIDGGGTLTVNANYNNGIQTKDDLFISGGTLVVNSVDDGIVGRDSITVTGGKVTVTSGGDAIKSTNEKEGKGDIMISGGAVNLDAGEDGIQCIGTIRITGGDFQIICAGGSANAALQSSSQSFGFGGGDGSGGDDTGSASRKGIKSEVGTIISGGTLLVDAADDAIHSNGSIVISGGAFTLSSGDDGIHADEQLTIEDCERLDILTSYEGLEAYNISISGGEISIVASDDGINISDSKTETSSTQTGGMNADNGGMLTITGGNIRVNAGGDGLDSNGSIVMNGGTVIVDGPESSGDGALDYNGSFTITGGILMAAGAAGMAETPSDATAQNAVSMTFDSTLPAGSEVLLTDDCGNTVLSYTAEKSFQNIVLSSAGISTNSSYNILVNGEGIVTFTVSSGVTYVSSSGVTTGRQVGMGGFGGNGGGRGGIGRQ